MVYLVSSLPILPHNPRQEIKRGSPLLRDIFIRILETDAAEVDFVLAGAEACVCFFGKGIEWHAEFATGFDAYVVMDLG